MGERDGRGRGRSSSRESRSKKKREEPVAAPDPEPTHEEIHSTKMQKVPDWKPKDPAGFIEVVLLIWMAAFPVLVFIMTFSAFGYGAETHEYLKEHAWAKSYFVGFGLSTILFLYIMDASYWEGTMKKVKYLLLAFIVVAVVMGCLASAQDYPAAPMCVFMVGTVMYFIVLRKVLFFRQHGTEFFGYLAIAMVLVGSLCIVGFLDWITSDVDHYWPGTNNTLKEEYNNYMCDECRLNNVTVTVNETATVMDCIVSDLTDYSMCCMNYECLAGFLLWFSPFIAGFMCWIFGLLSYYLAKTITARSVLHPGVKIFASMVMCCIVAMWVASSVASTNGQMAQVVMMFAFVGVSLMGAFVVSVVGYHALMEMFMSIPLIKRIHDSFFSDVVRALFMVTASPLFLIYLVFSSLNQVFRKKLSCTKDLEEEDKGLWLTLVAHQQWVAMKGWAWSHVLVYSVYVNAFYLLINVGIAKMTTLFLAWLSEYLKANFETNAIVMIFYIVGLTMFLLPPVPGVPVYICGGVIMVSAFWPNDTSFFGAIFATAFICFLIKLNAIVVQQKGIGGQMAGSVAIRKMVGTNSISIQAIRLILEKPGFSLAKVSILCGGPDWPTSVLTGILRLPVSAMLMGSLPVFFLILPCVMAGAFMLRINEPGVWSSLAPVVTSLAALVQTVVMFAALYFIEQVTSDNHDLLLERCNDKEVADLEKKAAAKAAIYRAATDWHNPTFPKWMKYCLIFAFCTTTSACWFIAMNGEKCFAEFNLTDTIEEKLDGKASNIVLEKGWYAIGMFLIGCAFLKLFFIGASKRAKMPEFTKEGDAAQL